MEAQVCDSFDVKGRVAIDYGAKGVVAIVNTVGDAEVPEHGKTLLIVRPDGWMVRARMGEVKKHAEHGYGIFIANLTKQDVPVGAKLRWGTDFWPGVSKDQVEASTFVRV